MSFWIADALDVVKRVMCLCFVHASLNKVSMENSSIDIEING